MEKQWKKGDKVKCIDAGCNQNIKNGEIYELIRDVISTSESIRLKEFPGNSYYHYRFELVEEELSLNNQGYDF